MAEESKKLMILIDKIERLGVAYHFEKQIEEKLKLIYDSKDDEEEKDYDLFTVTLRFRLLRQHQYPVSCYVFNKFAEKNCKWKPESHGSNIEGILSLYEAANVRIWILLGNAFRYEPQYSYIRVIVAKNMQLVSIMDDTYDNYATLEEDDLFTEILERWNLDEIDVLPDFMKVVYRFIMSVYEDFVVDVEKEGKSFVVHSYREAVKQLGRAYNKEQKWIMERQMPGFEEYMTNSVITSCMYVIFTAIVAGMKSVDEASVQWLLNAISEFVELVENGWKDISAEWAKGSTLVPKEIVEQLLNYCRVAEVSKQDGSTYPEKYLIASLYVDPLPLHI
ncbi:hypothetical protein SASPL_101828 [Salvia splendens]|uniref:Uncharacterized protein n=1 Tax=Salvia splendens TaxID=180675 RepID=A0A8X9ABK3_SALSN|nr:hypothetical protein SASPL_101828 [Salvia splendens]